MGDKSVRRELTLYIVLLESDALKMERAVFFSGHGVYRRMRDARL